MKYITYGCCYLLFATSYATGSTQAQLTPAENSIEVIQVKASKQVQARFNASRTVTNIQLNNNDKLYRLEDISEYTAGISASTFNGGMNTSINIRGFSTGQNNILLNGHLDNQRMYVRDLDTIEAIQIEKGHSSITKGAASPGGSILYTTKQPKLDTQHQAEVTIGSHNKQRLMLDSTGETGYLGSAYRVVLIQQNAKTFMNNVGNDYTGVLTSLQIPYSSNGNARVEIQYDELQNPYSFGTVLANDKIYYDQSYVDPRTYSLRKNLRTSLYLSDDISNNISYNAILNYVDVDRDDKWMGFFYKSDNDNLVNYWATFDNRANQFNAKINLSGQFKVSGISNHFEVGVDRNNYTNQQVRHRSYGDFTLSIANPVFNQDEPIDVASKKDIGAKSSDHGVYFYNTAQVNQNFQLSLGARHSKFKLENLPDNRTEVEDQLNTYFVGAQYQLSSNLAVKGSISQSFEPNGGQAKTGRYFNPKEAIQKEIALGYKLSNEAQINLVLFKIEQSNLLSRDPQDRDYYIESGKHLSEGVELQFKSQLSELFLLNLQYTYLKNEIDDALSNNHGNTASNLPKQSLSGKLEFTSQNSLIKSYLGFVARQKRYGDLANRFELPGYVKFDLGTSYKLNNWQLKIDAHNILNKKYIAASYYEDDMYQGRTREVNFSVNYAW